MEAWSNGPRVLNKIGSVLCYRQNPTYLRRDEKRTLFKIAMDCTDQKWF
jgi:hypothetical protein